MITVCLEETMKNYIKINPGDNVCVALAPIVKGETLSIDDSI